MGQRCHGLCDCNATKGGHQHQLIPRFRGIDSFAQGGHTFLEKQQSLLGDFSADRGCLCGKIAFHQMRQRVHSGIVCGSCRQGIHIFRVEKCHCGKDMRGNARFCSFCMQGHDGILRYLRACACGCGYGYYGQCLIFCVPEGIRPLFGMRRHGRNRLRGIHRGTAANADEKFHALRDGKLCRPFYGFYGRVFLDFIKQNPRNVKAVQCIGDILLCAVSLGGGFPCDNHCLFAELRHCRLMLRYAASAEIAICRHKIMKVSHSLHILSLFFGKYNQQRKSYHSQSVCIIASRVSSAGSSVSSNSISNS